VKRDVGRVTTTASSELPVAHIQTANSELPVVSYRYGLWVPGLFAPPPFLPLISHSIRRRVRSARPVRPVRMLLLLLLNKSDSSPVSPVFPPSPVPPRVGFRSGANKLTHYSACSQRQTRPSSGSITSPANVNPHFFRTRVDAFASGIVWAIICRTSSSFCAKSMRARAASVA
jgi:hypothetical protein